MIYNELFESVIREAQKDYSSQLFESVLREADELNDRDRIWLNVQKNLKANIKPLDIVEFNEKNYKENLCNEKDEIISGYNSKRVLMATDETGEDLYKKLKTREGVRGLKAGRTILIAGIKETLAYSDLLEHQMRKHLNRSVEHLNTYPQV